MDLICPRGTCCTLSRHYTQPATTLQRSHRSSAVTGDSNFVTFSGNAAVTLGYGDSEHTPFCPLPLCSKN